MIRERILEYIDFKCISKYKFYKDTGLSNGFLDKKGSIGSDKCEIISYHYPDLSIEWLITGKGSMLKSGFSGGSVVLPATDSGLGVLMRRLKFADGVNLSDSGAPFYPLPVSAGNVVQLLNEQERPTGYINIPGVSCKAYFPVIGFSFEPLIRAGDIIGIDFLDSWDRIDPDCLYLIITVDNRMIKRLLPDPNNSDKLICLSTNLKEFSILKGDIKAIHKVVFFGRFV